MISPPGPPTTLGNMRELGVRSLIVTCELCHRAVLAADGWGDAVLIRAFDRGWSAPAAGSSALTQGWTGGRVLRAGIG
jgi:hypothetical protein